MIIRENKIKKRHIFERFWGFKMSVEGGSDRQQAGFLIIAAFGFPHGNENFARHLFNSSTSMFPCLRTSCNFMNCPALKLSQCYPYFSLQLEWEKHLICGSHNSRYQFVESVTNIKLLYVQDFQLLLKSIQLLISANENPHHNRSFLLFLMNVLFPVAVIVKVPVY